MKVLDTAFLIDYLDDHEAAVEYLLEHEDEDFIVPLPVFAEVLVGEGNQPGSADLAGIQNAIGWTELFDVDRRHAVLGAEIADEIGPEGPFLGGTDALIAAVGREQDAPVVSADTDLTHPETRKVIEVEDYKS